MAELKLKKVDVKNILNIGFPLEVEPEIPLLVYDNRIKKLRTLMKKEGFSTVLIYGDREHLGNIMYFTGYDPRFEETLLIVHDDDSELVLIVGNEGYVYSNVSPVPHRKLLFSPFSLAGQPCNSTADLASVLKDFIHNTKSVGLVGWKSFSASKTKNFAVPHFIVNAISQLMDITNLKDVTDWLMDPQNGLRSCYEIEQLAKFEWVSTWSSESVFRAISKLQDGQSEYEIASNMQLNGYPHAHHLCITSGDRLKSFFAGSPSSKKVKTGEPFFIALGLRGSNTCRAGFLVHDASELPENIRDYASKVVIPYFKAIRSWYQKLSIGTNVSELHRLVHSELKKPLFNIGLNIGHQIDYEEWMNSPVTENSTVELKSGNYYQCDFFPAVEGDYFGTFAEDGVALLNSSERREFEVKYPQAYKRIRYRRNIMKNILGIELSEDAMPFSNICGFIFPYLYDLNLVPSAAI
ncbi:MAG: hypothetical protein A2Y12_06895 [Planctomycetes bacterium GWF2_42_9]|nr:MAG: hypothetical protein A2Y12_06895 [Planctomycetes bacterium GWF2_42_9]